ncbi:baseplate assembly protein, putative [Labilithrix luteola]|uniref:Baseplate assembly protein, putative n=1 Tax=Labilithrix luteola TaxID=1391654 RepID=A0A0K1QBT4_9BACT|nr:baseplate J/gp47 family protein [Labilithrix luteola]AKV03198.1 baseplate assembly protein, putative [Labilithrix luteola]
MLPIEALINPPSSDAIYDKVAGVLETVKIPARSWRPGGVARSILGALCQVGAQGAALVSDITRGGFLSLGRGDYLASHVKDVYDEDKIGATFASGKLKLTNSGGAIYEREADTVIAKTMSGARYRITQHFVLGSNTYEIVDAQAVTAGSGSTAAPGEINDLETPLAFVKVENESAFVGLDAESDDSLATRARAKKGTWSQLGPRSAYESAARSAKMSDGTSAGITRVEISPSGSPVRVVCATASGTPTEEQLDAVRAGVEAQARPGGTSAVVTGATPVPTTHSITIWCRNAVADTVRARAESAMAAFIATYPIGGIRKEDGAQGYLWSDSIRGALLGDLRVTWGIAAYDLDFADDSDIPLAWDEIATNVTTFTVRVTK